MSKRKNTPEERLNAVQDYLSGKRSATQICQDLKLKSHQNIQEWVWLYQKHGEEAFIAREGNKSYSEQLKIAAVEEYLSAGGSVRSICAKYNISSTQTLRNWIKQYNSNIKLTDYDPKPEVYMAAARRKTTIDERKEIVEYCLSHNKDYKGSAEKYDVSYNQVYSWAMEKCEEDNLQYIDDRLIALSAKFQVEPRKLLSHVLEYTLSWPH